MACITGIIDSIVSTCENSPVGGLEVKSWLINRKDIDAVTLDGTNTNTIEAMTLKQGKRAWLLTGVKKLLNAGHDVVVNDARDDRYTHYFSFEQFEVDGAALLNVDQINDMVVICENKNKGVSGDGAFICLGLMNGLYKTSDTRRSNDTEGTRKLELASMAGQEEKYSSYVFFITNYATTLAAIEALETPAV